MKKEKGFTLIELLAVIIILGILMLVAIPSVTNYINNSRKSAYIDTALNYIKGAVNLVNEGKKVQFYDEDTLLMIPVGHGDESMVKLESGGQSPYNNKWYYAYVGVTYDNEHGSYSYFFTGADESGQGIGKKASGSDGGNVAYLVSEKDMEATAEELIVAGLRANTNLAGAALHTIYIGSAAVGKGANFATPNDTVGDLQSLITDTGNAKITNIVVCNGDCKVTRKDITQDPQPNQNNGG